jgi:hypothetical protein
LGVPLPTQQPIEGETPFPNKEWTVFRRHLSYARALVFQRTPLIVAALGLMLALGIASALDISRASAAISWRGDLEPGDFSQWNLGVQEKVSGRASIVTSPGRQGRYAARYEVDPGDNNVAGSSATGERTESLTSQDTTDGYEGHEDWYAWSTMFAPGFSSNDSGWNAFTQFHNTGTSGQSMQFDVVGNTLIFLSYGGDFANPQHCEAVLDQNKQNGVWYDFVFHVKWSSNPSVGFFEIFENGKRVVSQTSCTTLYSGQGVYLKQGYYRVAQPNTAVIYDDGMRRGGSYSDVIGDFPAGTWPSSAGGSISAAPATTTAATTTTAPAPAPATTTTAGATTTTTVPPTTTTAATTTTTTAPPPPATTTTTTTTGNNGNGNGNGNSNNNGKKPPKTDSGTRLLADANVVRRAPAANIRVVSAVVSARSAGSLRISVVSRRGQHLRIPILAHSRVGSIETRYWRKTLVTGPVQGGRAKLMLRVPRARLQHGKRYTLRVRALEPAGSIKTVYLRFRG